MPMKLLDPEVMAKAESLGLQARQIVEGYRVGEHRSPFHGFALEFAQHREYGLGDDLKHLDWKLLGKTDRLYIKQYEQDTNFTANLLLDGSASMNYGSGKLTKLEYAKILAACLAHTILAQRDAVALDIFDTANRVHMTRTDNPGRLHEILARLAGFEATAATDLGGALRDLASQVRAKGIVVLLSDLLEGEEEFYRGIERLRFQGMEVIVFHVLDPEEITFPLQGPIHFHGLEGGPDLLANAEDIRAGYRAECNAFLARIRLACERANIHYVLANTGVTVGETLNAYLAFRRKTTAR